MVTDALVVSLSVNELKDIVSASVKQELQIALPALDELKNQKQTAEILKCSHPTLLRYRKQKLIAEVVVGKRVYFKTSEIYRLLSTKR